MSNISDIKGAHCNHYYNGKFMFDPDDPKSKCKLCGALCKDIFKIENNSVMLKPSISKW